MLMMVIVAIKILIKNGKDLQRAYDINLTISDRISLSNSML